MFTESVCETTKLSKEERITKREERKRLRLIDQKVIVDLEKKIEEDSGEQYIEDLKKAVSKSDDQEIKDILYQIGHDIHVIMKEKDAPFVDATNPESYIVGCLTGTAGQRGYLNFGNDVVKLNFTNIDDREYNSNPSMRTAVEQLFKIKMNENNSYSIRIN